MLEGALVMMGLMTGLDTLLLVMASRVMVLLSHGEFWIVVPFLSC